MKTKRSTDETDSFKADDKKVKLETMASKLQFKNFNNSAYNLAKSLLGKILVRKYNDEIILKAKIVETECYPGGEDKASATYNNRRTEANEPLYMEPGTAYIYMTYGMYYCFNISSEEPGGGVLLRALEPIQGFETMQELRIKKRKSKNGKLFKENELCNGPSKLCTSLDINKTDFNKINMSENELLWIEDDSNIDFKIVESTRIGIDRAGSEWSKKPYRFYILGNSHVSKIDTIAESTINN